MNTQKGLSSFGLKYIALLTMTIDHATMVLLPYGTTLYTIGRNIGRIAFPVFCFLLVEGFFHTSNRRSYLTRLGLFALISEIPFDMALFQFPRFTDLSILMSHQNVYFTLFLGFLAMCLIEEYNGQGAQKSLAALGIGVVVCALAEFLRTDYSAVGIMVILLYYIYKTSAADGSPILSRLLPMLPLLGYGNFFVLLAVPFMILYDGRKGSALPGGQSFPGAKYLFYVYYPVHLAVLSLIADIC